ncbi:hypothetical protein A2773_02305 [Candidatus Gottesmanbacteria bacterium RIFCSPHIGHO2_01_FULL_39_10]|uniref:Carbohydrate kinase PfkB domain-containing protein n=1 Tax=Candidatus Gottesmanbacteria bacterium RIFCSPHIGHO2_01_FULL_39_10 TaxID=1798375 RepID=A0A1F5ZR85_9BACT|nr:MAG: hypothetical protein A2773_02305 [Candidatus Gottesmanbacteria bacterium RIFCSPHIGHO2_01_FULL_39_10]
MILVTGSLAYDMIMDFPGAFSEHIDPGKVHMLNVSFLVDEMRKGFGGTAGNIAYNLSLLGVRTALLSVVGADFSSYKEFLDKNEVDTSYIKTINTFYTSTAFGVTDRDDNQIWGFYTGADKLTENLSIHDIEGKIDFGIIAPHNPRAMIKFAQEYTKENIPYLFDPGMQLPWLNATDLKTGIKGAKIVIGNDYEMGVIKNKLNIKEKDQIGNKDQIIITTKGSLGSKIDYQGKVYEIPAVKVRSAEDPAGAGDAYRAGFMAGYLRGFEVDTCGRMGAVASAYTVEKYGTTTHKYNMEQFVRRYEDNFGESLDLI